MNPTRILVIFMFVAAISTAIMFAIIIFAPELACKILGEYNALAPH